MLTRQLPPWLSLAVRMLALAAALSAAAIGWHAARLWIRASKIELPPFDPPVASIGDVPELHIMSTSVQLNEAIVSLQQSNDLNSRAARWTALAAIMTGAATLLGAI